MRILRGLGGAVLWLLAAVLGLVAVILCVTVILLPLGLPLLGLARRMFTNGVRLMLPRAVAHPVKTLDKGGRDRGRKAKAAASDVAAKTSTKARRATRTAGRKTKKARPRLRRGRRLLG